MATAAYIPVVMPELPAQRERSGSRRRPFSTWVRKLANFNKSLSLSSSPATSHTKTHAIATSSHNSDSGVNHMKRPPAAHHDRHHLRNRSRHRAESTPMPPRPVLPHHGNSYNATNPNEATSPSGRRPKLTYHLKPKKVHVSKNNNPYPQSARLTELIRYQSTNRRSRPHSNSMPSFFSTSPTAARSTASLESSFIEIDTSNGELLALGGAFMFSGRIILNGASDDASVMAIRSEDGETIGGDAASVTASIVSSGSTSPPTIGGARSIAATVLTDHEAARSIALSALTATTTRTPGHRSGADSMFSSPAPSVRSLATTLTTIQSSLAAPGANQHHYHHHSSGSHTTITFQQPFPTGSSMIGPSAIPAHLQPSNYHTATANNLLTDNASILTLASSSKRRRRRSFDTDASIRAMAPSSLWGGSRESLPLSVLSANLEARDAVSGAGVNTGLSAERASIYSTMNDRTDRSIAGPSTFAGPSTLTKGDGSSIRSIRSGLFGHGRTDSVSGSIAGLTGTTSLVSPMEEGDGDMEGWDGNGNGEDSSGREDKGKRKLKGNNNGKEMETEDVVYN